MTAELDGGSRSAATTVKVNVNTAMSSAVRGTDYTAPTALGDNTVDITIPMANQTSGSAAFTFNITPTPDTIDEGDETVVIGGTSDITVNTATLTITDDPADVAMTTIQLSTNPTSVTEASAGTAVTVTVTARLDGTVSRGTDTVVTLGDMLGGDADPGAGNDYTHTYADLTDKTITIPAGSLSATSGTFTITPLQDRVTEPGGETIVVTGSATGLTVSQASIELSDNDSESTTMSLSVAPANIGENDGAAPVTVTATLDGGTRLTDTTVTLSVASGSTADRNTDYTAPAALGDNALDITIPMGELTGEATFSIAPIPDDIDEGTGETIEIDGSASGSPTITAVSSATLTIDDGTEDVASTTIDLSTTPTSLVEDDDSGTDFTVTATLQGTITRSVPTVVTLGSSLGGGAGSGDYTHTYGSLTKTITIPAGALAVTTSQTFKITPTDDSLTETGGETIEVSGSACRTAADPCPTAQKFTVNNATITLNDDDTASTSLTLTVSPISIAENAVGNAMGNIPVSVTAELDGGTRSTATTVKVSVDTDMSTAVRDTDYTAASSLGDNTVDITIPANQTSGSATYTFNFNPTSDNVEEGNETVVIGGTTGITNFTVNPATLTITDDPNDNASTTIQLSTDSHQHQ